MLESRIKIWFGQDIKLAVQQRIDCNFLTEGCHGGWAYFDMLFLENYGAVEESCIADSDYKSSLSPEGCSKWSKCSYKASVEDTYYIGDGYYGGMSEQDMIKELRARGPITLDFNTN